MPLDHAFSFELADVEPGCNEVLRQCGRADGRGLVGDGGTVNANASDHCVQRYCVATELAFRFQRK